MIVASRIRVYTLADAGIFSPFDRTQYAVYWKQASGSPIWSPFTATRSSAKRMPTSTG
jgi:hypothetical protein